LVAGTDFRWLKIQYRNNQRMRISHETIYRSLFIQARGVLKKELIGHLRSKRRIRRSQHARIFNDPAVKSQMLSQSGNAPPKSRIARWPVIGKAI
jgi:IS30 family transposase